MADNKELLIEAAQKTFAKFGFRKTTLDDIAQQLGKGKTSIYYYFQGKDDVFRAVLQKEVNEFVNELATSVKHFDTPQLKLKAYVETRMRMISQAKVFHDAISNDQLSTLEMVRTCAGDFDNAKMSLLKIILLEGIDSGVFRLHNAELASLAIETSLKGLDTFFVNGLEPEGMQEQIDNLLHLLFHGVLHDK